MHLGGQPLTLGGAQLLGVAQALQAQVPRQNHGGCDHGAKERAAAYLIHAGNTGCPLPTRLALVVVVADQLAQHSLLERRGRDRAGGGTLGHIFSLMSRALLSGRQTNAPAMGRGVVKKTAEWKGRVRRAHDAIAELAALHFLEAGCLAAESAQVEQLGAAHLGRANLDHTVDDLRVEGENALHPLAEADLANGEASLRAILAGNHNALKRLKALFFAFLDLDLHAHRVARRKGGQVGTVDFLGKPLHDWMNRHSSSLTIDSESLVYKKMIVLRTITAVSSAGPAPGASRGTARHTTPCSIRPLSAASLSEHLQWHGCKEREEAPPEKVDRQPGLKFAQRLGELSFRAALDSGHCLAEYYPAKFHA